MGNLKLTQHKQVKFVYGLEPEILGGDGETFVLADKQAALIAAQAWQARTWGEFVRVANTSLDRFLEDWGDEIEGFCGKTPTASDTFSFGEYWGLTYFADVITDPRQAAYDAVMASPNLRKVCKEAGLDFHPGFPGFAGIEAITFHDEQNVDRLRLAGVNIAKDDALMLSSLLQEPVLS
jgi:hypothetical protein